MTSAAEAEAGGVSFCGVGVLAAGVFELGASDGGGVCCPLGGALGAEPPDAFAAGASGTSFAPSLFADDAGVDAAAGGAAGAAGAEPLAGALALAAGSELALEFTLSDGALAPLAIEPSNGDPSTPLPQPLSAATETQTQQNFRMTTPRRGGFPAPARAADVSGRG